MADQYFINRSGKIFGPFSKEAVKQASSTNKLTADDLISTSKAGPWKKLQRTSEETPSAKQPARPPIPDAFKEDLEDSGMSFKDEADDVNYDEFGEDDLPALPSRRSKKTYRQQADDEDDFQDRSYASKGKKSSREMSSADNVRLAAPYQRLFAAIVDAIAGWLFVFPPAVLFFIGLQSPQSRPGELPFLAMAGQVFIIFGLLAYSAISLYMQATRAQSIGKWYLNLQIFDAGTMQPADFVKNWVIRTFVNYLLLVIPFYGLIDLCFIFTDRNQCLHDRLAGTVVMDISPE